MKTSQQADIVRTTTNDTAVEETYQDIQAALEDIDKNDPAALYQRCSQILDDIHAGRF